MLEIVQVQKAFFGYVHHWRHGDKQGQALTGLWWPTPIQPPGSLETPDPNITPPPNAYITEGFKDDAP